MNDTVRLTIERIDITDIALPGDVLLDITETTESVLERGRLDNRALVPRTSTVDATHPQLPAAPREGRGDDGQGDGHDHGCADTAGHACADHHLGGRCQGRHHVR
ncbi:hypothetical protein [Nocardioides sp. S5]|uniref:hypothetical protein n=1 Tax=Nocardioides sp. S5 TaxID=2017486 RepID=UPI001A8DBAE2|nr:hypothetical protein [Nocardioides sp. S5]